jgi:hypothetical protein
MTVSAAAPYQPSPVEKPEKPHVIELPNGTQVMSESAYEMAPLPAKPGLMAKVYHIHV